MRSLKPRGGTPTSIRVRASTVITTSGPTVPTIRRAARGRILTARAGAEKRESIWIHVNRVNGGALYYGGRLRHFGPVCRARDGGPQGPFRGSGDRGLSSARPSAGDPSGALLHGAL